MFLLDTNIVSEARRKDPAAVEWLQLNRRSEMYLSVVTIGEIAKGVAMLERRDAPAASALSTWLGSMRQSYSQRILPVDEAVMLQWGRLAALRSRGDLDAIIAATAQVHGLSLVTRNVRDFSDLDLQVINPWGI